MSTVRFVSVTAVAGLALAAGNPGGHFPVPPAGRAVDTRHPDHVIGNGRPASCTSAAVVRAVAAGGVITFNCGPKPVTIVMTTTASVIKTRHLVVLDGGGLVTLSGGGKRRILYSDTCAGTWSTDDCVNQPYPQIVVQNITFKDGYDGTHQATCTANVPRCWYGGVDGGGAIYVEGGQFKAVNSRFVDNRCYAYGPDLGGGAIRALAQYQNRPVYITNDTFRGGRCSNGGALSSISVQWDDPQQRVRRQQGDRLGGQPGLARHAGRRQRRRHLPRRQERQRADRRHRDGRQQRQGGRRRRLRRRRHRLGRADVQRVASAPQHQRSSSRPSPASTTTSTGKTRAPTMIKSTDN